MYNRRIGVMLEKKDRILTGDRPTGKMHIGHYFRFFTK